MKEKREHTEVFAVYAHVFVGSFLTLLAHGMIGINQGLDETMEMYLEHVFVTESLALEYPLMLDHGPRFQFLLEFLLTR